MPETAARLRHHRAAPTKVREVLRLVVGRPVAEAREILRFCERGAAGPVMKLLDSAIANAEHNDHLSEDELFVARAFADEGPTSKRWRPRARGRGTRIRKRTSHITIVVARFSDAELERRRRREAEAGRAAKPSRRRRVAASRRRTTGETRDHDHDHGPDEEAEETVEQPQAEGVEAETADQIVAELDASDDETPAGDTPEVEEKSE